MLDNGEEDVLINWITGHFAVKQHISLKNAELNAWICEKRLSNLMHI